MQRSQFTAILKGKLKPEHQEVLVYKDIKVIALFIIVSSLLYFCLLTYRLVMFSQDQWPKFSSTR